MRLQSILLVTFLVVVFTAFSARAQPAGDLITSLPLFNGTLWPQYSGYAVVNATHGRALHYWFVSSQSETPDDDPVVLWLNGGPGCSSLDGFLYENGPYTWADGGNEILLNNNPYAWNKVANMIYLESPAGVGFSYSNTSSDYATSDWQTAQDNHAFLLWFFQQFPSLAANDFWIAGESYAGTYIPTLSKVIIESTNNTINFQGILVGNGVTDPIYDGPFISVLPFEYGHGLIGPITWQQIQTSCYPVNTTVECQNLVNQSYSVFNDIDIYNIIGDCYSQRPLLTKDSDSLYFPSASASSSASSSSGGPNIVPCTNSYNGYEYLNMQSVKEAIHVRTDITWEICSNYVFFNYNSNAGSMLNIYPELIKAGLQILIYSGDVDGRVPFTGTGAWVDSLGQPLVEYWAPWYFTDDEGLQTGGFKTTYEGIEFITIRGSGHMVPQYAPAAAFTFFSKFLSGTTI